MSQPTYSLEDLAERSDTPARTIRYYIQRGLVSRPVGEKRGAHYTAEHLGQLLQIRRWVAAGMSLQRIGELMQEAQGTAADEAGRDMEILSASRSVREALPSYALQPHALQRPQAAPPAPEAPAPARAASPAGAMAAAGTGAGAGAGANANANEASLREPASEYPHTLKLHYPVAPGVEVVIDPARRPLSAAEAEELLAVIREHLARLDGH